MTHRSPPSRTLDAAPVGLPPGLWKVTLGVFLLLLGDGPAVGGLAAQLLRAPATNPAIMAVLGTHITSYAGATGNALGGLCAFAYMVYPMQFVASRSTLGLRGLRAVAWFLVAAHPVLLAALAYDVTQRIPDRWFVFLPLPLCVLATAFLPSMVVALQRMLWLDPAVDAGRLPAHRPASRIKPGLHSGTVVSATLPFVAAYRASRPVMAVLTLLLWVGGMMMLFMAPLRSVVPLALAASLGLRAGRYTSVQLTRVVHAAPDNELEPAAPRWLPVGLLTIPLLCLADAIALVAYFVLRRAETIAGFLNALSEATFLLIVPVAFVLFPIMMLLPLWLTDPALFRRGMLALRLIGLTLLGAYASLLFFFGTLAFHLTYWGWGITIEEPVRLLLVPAAWSLLAVAPSAVLLAMALAQCPKLVTPTGKTDRPDIGRVAAGVL